MRRWLCALLFGVGLALQAAPALAAPCESEWRSFETGHGGGTGGWQTYLNEGMTYDNQVKAIRALVYSDLWNKWGGGGEKPADPVAAFRKLATVFGSQMQSASDADARASLMVAVCLANAFADEAARQPSRPRRPLTAKDDLLEACAPAIAQLRAAEPTPEENFDANRAVQAGLWANSPDPNSLNDRLASDAAWNAAHPEGPLPGDHVQRRMSDLNDCFIRRRLVQIAQGIPRPPGPQSPASQSAPQSRANRQVAMNAPPKPKEDPDAPRKGDSGQPNPNQLYKNKPAVAENASRCMGLIQDPRLFGGFTNACGFDVYVAWCAYHPKKGAWSEAFDCDKPGAGMGGLSSVRANAVEGSHTHNAERIFWFACRRPSFPKVEYTSGSGFFGHCQ
jgi:hypothetical protein